jgi:hypothetical protein
MGKNKSPGPAPEALGAYQRRVAQRMQMAVEDGRRLSDDYQKVM